jgi:hypothetical protein
VTHGCHTNKHKQTNKGTVRVSEVSEVVGVRLDVERNGIFGGKGLVLIEEFEIIPGT